MDAIKEFTIPFVGLKEGKHQFKFTIDNTFFAHFEFNDFDRATLNGELILEKKSSFLELQFDIKGTVVLPCDVSMEWFDCPIATQFNLIVKFGSAKQHKLQMRS